MNTGVQCGSEIRPFEIRNDLKSTFWRSDFKWSVFSHLKTGPFKIRTKKSGFQMVKTRWRLVGFQMVGLPDFRSHSKSGPFTNQPLFDHLKSGQGRISDPHCSQHSIGHCTIIDLFQEMACHCRRWYDLERWQGDGLVALLQPRSGGNDCPGPEIRIQGGKGHSWLWLSGNLCWISVVY